MPKFSILIPIIKSKFLATAIESVLKQSFSDWELILYNDCSPEDIESVVNKFSDKRIKYFKGEKNLGAEDPSRTWNTVVSLAIGEFVILLGDDDCISVNFLEEISRLSKEYISVNVLRARMARINEDGKEISHGELLPEFETWDQSMYQRNVKKRPQSTVEFALRRNALLEIGGYVNFPRACGSDDATYLLLAKKGGIVSSNEAIGYWRKSSLNISDNDSAEINKYKIKFLLNWEKDFLNKELKLNVPLHELYASLDEEGITLKDEFQSANIEFDFAKQSLKEKDIELDFVKQSLKEKNAELDFVKQSLKEKNAELDFASSQLRNINESREWKMILILQKIIKKIIPVGSLRRKWAISFGGIIKKTIKFGFKIARGIRSSILFVKQYFLKFKPRKKRKINKNSKKLAYIGHSYHNKTKSTVFLIEYLKKFYDVEIVLDESWNGGTYPDVSFIDESYLGVVLFQNLPGKEILKSIKNDNIIFFPMYDGVPHDFAFWGQHYELKVVNFSKTLHKKLSKWGLESMFVQYFPSLQEFIPGKKEEVFFWQRLTKMNIDLVSKLFGDSFVRMHIHKAIDPEQQFQQPSEQQEAKYQITYSDWFETREQLWDVIKQKGIYIAPREYEGIGMSFLEAMAMGKAVVAVNNPTMNEYIEHGKNGYLFDLKNPKEINFSDVEQVQKNTHKFMKKGFEKWEKDKYKIIEFIEKS